MFASASHLLRVYSVILHVWMHACSDAHTHRSSCYEDLKCGGGGGQRFVLEDGTSACNKEAGSGSGELQATVYMELAFA